MYSIRRDQREKLYKAYISRADSGNWDNKLIIPEILQLRRELANIIGYETYADFSLASKMASNTNVVFKMLDELFAASNHHQIREFESLEQIAKEHGQIEALEHWDTSYWAEP